MYLKNTYTTLNDDNPAGVIARQPLNPVFTERWHLSFYFRTSKADTCPNLEALIVLDRDDP